MSEAYHIAWLNTNAIPHWISPDKRILLINHDCRAVLPTLDKGIADCTVVDPPYGVNLGNHGGANEKRPNFLVKGKYDGYDDTPENFESIVVPAIRKAISISGRGAVFVAGTQAWSLPRPDAVGGVYLPAGNGRCSWGFQNLSHCLFYGKCPDLNLGAKHIVHRSTEVSEDNGHPCPKPIGWMVWAVNLASREHETILDPFMGSGTTGVACVKLNRRFIGIEISPKYFAIAVKRIEAALAQPNLYIERERAHEQLSLAEARTL